MRPQLSCITILTVVISRLFHTVKGEKTEAEFLKELEIYSSLDKLLSYFRNETHPLAQEIVDTFENDCRFPDLPVPERGSLIKPVIVIEGNHKSSRDVVVMGLTELMNARYVTHPAPCIHRFHKLLPKGSLFRRAFYILSLYAGSFYAKSQLNKPIIINGYWTEQMAFTMTHFYPPRGLPPISSDIFKFPEDLLKPDLIFYLNFPDNLVYSYVTTRSPITWKPRMLEAYRHMAARHPIVVRDVKSFFKLTTEEIHRYIHEHLYDKVFGIRNRTVVDLSMNINSA